MKSTLERLEDLAKKQPKFLRKNGLCVGLIVTEAAQHKGLPLKPEVLLTSEGGQVAGLGKAAVQRILKAYGIDQILAEEGGRTSRGSIRLMELYVKALNEMHKFPALDLSAVQKWWIEKVRAYFAQNGPKFHFDPGKSFRAHIEDLLRQAETIQRNAGRTNFVGALLLHLVGAMLDLVLGPGKITHHGFTVADQPTARKADFEIDGTAIHVTTHPTEALVRKCAENLKAGLIPLIITLGSGVAGAANLLEQARLADRVDVLDSFQFFTANIYEHSLFQTSACKVTLAKLIARYNEIVTARETDPSLRIVLKEA